MSASSTLLQLPPLQWNQPLSYHHRCALFYSKHQRKSSNLIRLKISVKYKQSTSSDTDSNRSQILKSSFDKIAIQIKKTLDSLKKPAITAVLLGLLLFYDPNWALAASGGRIGGNAFSSRSRSSSSSQSYSVPRTSNPSFSYSAPYYGPSPFGGGGLYVGPAVGFGFGGFSSFSLILFGFAAFVLVSGFLSDRSEGDSVLTDTQKTSVIKLQVTSLFIFETLLISDFGC